MSEQSAAVHTPAASPDQVRCTPEDRKAADGDALLEDLFRTEAELEARS